MIFMVNIHHSRAADILAPDLMMTDPALPLVPYRDGFGNWCTRLMAPAGRLRVSASGLVQDTGEPDAIPVAEYQHPVHELPEETLVYLLGSRYCETDRLSSCAWNLFGQSAPGVRRIQAICDWVHQHITFNYQEARPTRTASEALEEGRGVCRDFAHLAIAFCRCMNIPARYCTGYLGDIRIPALPGSDGFFCLVRGLHRRRVVYSSPSTRGTTHRGSAACSSVADGMPRTWQSVTRSARVPSRGSPSWLRKSAPSSRTRSEPMLFGFDMRDTQRSKAASVCLSTTPRPCHGWSPCVSSPFVT